MRVGVEAFADSLYCLCIVAPALFVPARLVTVIYLHIAGKIRVSILKTEISAPLKYTTLQMTAFKQHLW